jgi:hypothetical protein
MKKIFQIAILLFVCTLSANLAQAQVATGPATSPQVNVTTAAVQGIAIGASGKENTAASGILMGASTGVVAGSYSSTTAQSAIGAQNMDPVAVPQVELSK